MLLVLATALLLAVALYSRVLQGSWGAPGAFFALVWIVAAVPATILIPQAVTSEAVLFVLSFVIAVLAGSQLAIEGSIGAVRPYSTRDGAGMRRLDRSMLVAMATLLGICGMVAAICYVKIAGYSLLQLGQSSTWFRIAVHYSVARYWHGYVEPLSVRFLAAANFAGAIVGGVALALTRGSLKRTGAVTPVISSVLLTMLTTEKAFMLFCVAFTFAGWLSVKAASQRDAARAASLRQYMRLGAIAAIGAAVFVTSLVLRYGSGGSDENLILGRIGGYVLGQMAAVSAWLSVINWSELTPKWGVMTFSGLAETLHLAHRVPGLYAPIGLNRWAAQTNVFSALRSAVVDFGLVGAWLGAVLLGWIGGFCYERLRRGSGTARSILGLAVFYGFSAWSPITSLFTYDVLLLAIVVAGVVITIGWPEILRGIRSSSSAVGAS